MSTPACRSCLRGRPSPEGLWIDGYKINRESTVRQARTHIRHIVREFGDEPLSALRPSQVKAWTARLREDHEPSYVYALHSRLSQILSDAVHDGVLGRNPCSRRTSPSMGKQKPYVATTEQVWALHDAMPEHPRVAILLGAFVGLRIADVSGLRVVGVDVIRGVVNPVQQWPSGLMVTNGCNGDGAGPWLIERAVRQAKVAIAESENDFEDKVLTLPERFSFHDLRHYLASLLIASGADIKTVQARMRYASASTTLDTYSHLWPDADESTRSRSVL
jgi:integrase